MSSRRPSIKHKAALFSGKTVRLQDGGGYRRILRDENGKRTQSTQNHPLLAWKISWEEALKKTLSGVAKRAKGKP